MCKTNNKIKLEIFFLAASLLSVTNNSLGMHRNIEDVRLGARFLWSNLPFKCDDLICGAQGFHVCQGYREYKRRQRANREAEIARMKAEIEKKNEEIRRHNARVQKQRADYNSLQAKLQPLVKQLEQFLQRWTQEMPQKQKGTQAQITELFRQLVPAVGDRQKTQQLSKQVDQEAEAFISHIKGKMTELQQKIVLCGNKADEQSYNRIEQVISKSNALAQKYAEQHNAFLTRKTEEYHKAAEQQQRKKIEEFEAAIQQERERKLEEFEALFKAPAEESPEDDALGEEMPIPGDELGLLLAMLGALDGETPEGDDEQHGEVPVQCKVQ